MDGIMWRTFGWVRSIAPYTRLIFTLDNPGIFRRSRKLPLFARSGAERRIRVGTASPMAQDLTPDAQNAGTRSAPPASCEVKRAILPLPKIKTSQEEN